MDEIVYIAGPYYDYAEARELWETVYYGYDGPYWLSEEREGVWYIVSDAEYENVTNED